MCSAGARRAIRAAYGRAEQDDVALVTASDLFAHVLVIDQRLMASHDVAESGGVCVRGIRQPPQRDQLIGQLRIGQLNHRCRRSLPGGVHDVVKHA